MFESITLENDFVRLEPLSEHHIPPLLEIAQEAPQAFGLTTVPPTLEGMTAYVHTALEARREGKALPFATFSKALGRVSGSTRLANLEFWPWAPGNPLAKTDGTPDAAEIGWTWLEPAAQRTRVNTAAKLLMLGFAFETWQVRRVTLKTDARNLQSRNAILRLGAQFEGVLRAHVPAADGGVRDSAMFSILTGEWPEVKSRLEASLMR